MGNRLKKTRGNIRTNILRLKSASPLKKWYKKEPSDRGICWIPFRWEYCFPTAAAAAKSLQSCPTLCNPIDSSLPGSSILGILQARTLEWVAISFSNAWKWKVKVKSLSHVWLFATPWTAAYQAPPSMGVSRQEYWSGVPLLALSKFKFCFFETFWNFFQVFSVWVGWIHGCRTCRYEGPTVLIFQSQTLIRQKWFVFEILSNPSSLMLL